MPQRLQDDVKLFMRAVFSVLGFGGTWMEGKEKESLKIRLEAHVGRKLFRTLETEGRTLVFVLWEMSMI